MIDFTTTQARDYSRVIEAPGITQDQIDSKAAEVLRGLNRMDIDDALYDCLDNIKASILAQDSPAVIGLMIHKAVNDYCKRVALRVLEA